MNALIETNKASERKRDECEESAMITALKREIVEAKERAYLAEHVADTLKMQISDQNYRMIACYNTIRHLKNVIRSWSQGAPRAP